MYREMTEKECSDMLEQMENLTIEIGTQADAICCLGCLFDGSDVTKPSDEIIENALHGIYLNLTRCSETLTKLEWILAYRIEAKQD